MGDFWRIVGTVLMLIALYLVLTNYTAFNTIFNSLGGFGLAETGTLQGRTVSGFGGVTVGNQASTSNNSIFGGILG